MNTSSVKANEKSAPLSLHARRALAYIVLTVLCFLCLFFFYVLAMNATHSHYEIQRGFNLLPGRDFMKNLSATLADSSLPVLKGIRNSLLISALSALLSIYFSALTAYGIYAYDFRLKKLAFTFIILIMSMPTQISALGFVRLIGRMGGTNHLWPLFLPAIASPTVFYFMIQYMKSSLPMEIVEAARIDGCSEFGTFNRVVLPLLKPAVTTAAVLTFLNTWNEFTAPLYFLNNSTKWPMTLSVYNFFGMYFKDWNLVCADILLTSLPVLTVYLLGQKYIVSGMTTVAVKG